MRSRMEMVRDDEMTTDTRQSDSESAEPPTRYLVFCGF